MERRSKFVTQRVRQPQRRSRYRLLVFVRRVRLCDHPAMLRLFQRGKDAKSDKPDAKSDEPAVELSGDVDVQDQPAVLEAWTTHVLDRPELIRARAVNGATICAAVATALAAFGGLKGLSGRPVEVQFAVVAAVITWLGSVWLYSCAIVYSHRRKHPNEPAAKTVNELVKRFDNYAGAMRTPRTTRPHRYGRSLRADSSRGEWSWRRTCRSAVAFGARDARRPCGESGCTPVRLVEASRATGGEGPDHRSSEAGDSAGHRTLRGEDPENLASCRVDCGDASLTARSRCRRAARTRRKQREFGGYV